MVKYRQFKFELKEKGCYIIRHGAEHDIWFSPVTETTTSIPRHDSKEVPKGLEKKIRKVLGVDK
jgi:hypothetical protein